MQAGRLSGAYPQLSAHASSTPVCLSPTAGSFVAYLGFQWGSRISTRVAAVKVSPSPPTCTSSQSQASKLGTGQHQCRGTLTGQAAHLAGQQEHLCCAAWSLKGLHTSLRSRQSQHSCPQRLPSPIHHALAVHLTVRASLNARQGLLGAPRPLHVMCAHICRPVQSPASLQP